MAQGLGGNIQRLMHLFLPKEEEFFKLFYEMSDHAHRAAQLLHELYTGHPNPEEIRDQVSDLEHQVDDLRHECTSRLNRTFVTPIMFDRQDIIDVADELDNVVDFIRAAADRSVLYNVRTIPPSVGELAAILVEVTGCLRDGVALLPKLRDSNVDFVKEVNTLENKGDVVLKQGLAALFRDEQDPIEILKWKEILDYVEEAIDHTEDTVNSIEAALVKNS
ncbi:MAG: DUF47 family protein [Chthonomonadales bacterium]|nr:DUF47 family protein [Chthonomonadales bacterium]